MFQHGFPVGWVCQSHAWWAELRRHHGYRPAGVWTNHREDGVAQSVEHWTANLAARVRSPVGEEPSDLICAFLHVQMESNWAGLSVCYCRHTGQWCGTIKAVGNTDHTRQTWIHMQTPLFPLAGCGLVGEGTSGKVLNWTVRSLIHATPPPTIIHVVDDVSTWLPGRPPSQVVWLFRLNLLPIFAIICSQMLLRNSQIWPLE